MRAPEPRLLGSRRLARWALRNLDDRHRPHRMRYLVVAGQIIALRCTTCGYEDNELRNADETPPCPVPWRC